VQVRRISEVVSSSRNSKGGQAAVQLEPGRYRAFWFSATTGEQIDLPHVDGPVWNSPAPPDANDWAILLQKES
jgi:hypothetical protein